MQKWEKENAEEKNEDKVVMAGVTQLCPLVGIDFRILKIHEPPMTRRCLQNVNPWVDWARLVTVPFPTPF